MASSAYRLPTAIRPRRYDVALDARLNAPDFSGQVAIQLEIAAPTAVVELHARDLLLDRATLALEGANLEGRVELAPAEQVARIRFPQAIPAGAALLTLAFRGRISESLQGLYRATDGPEEVLCTQCEATAARMIFPCFDEPAFKARFAFEITTAPGATVLTNTPLLSSQPVAGGTQHSFAASAPMSTYLIGLVIGDVASTPEQIVNGVPLRVWAMRGREGLGSFALTYTARLLPWFEDYFAVPYHFAKLDQVAVPGFAAGAMENTGLILYRQRLLLRDPRTTAWPDEKSIARVIAHEFGHQWFGDLVTMQWWDDIWLNEAFADWVAHSALEALDPQYGTWLDFQRSLRGALESDAMAATHPIYSPVATEAEAEELFDAITYTKGCGVLRMLEIFLGADAFRQGIRTYLAAFAERNARSADLWRHLAAASAAPVTEIMESWIGQRGFPVLHVAGAGGGSSTQLLIRQERFFARPAAPADATLWRVPVVVRYADDAGIHELRCLPTEALTAVELPVQGTLAWCYANADQAGVYRLDPDPALLAGLRAHLGELRPAEQIGLLDDQWALVQQGTATLDSFLKLLTALSTSDDHQVLLQALAQLHILDDILDWLGETAARSGFRAWVAGLFAPRLATLGFAPQPGESQNVAQVRAALVDALAVIARAPDALAAARAAAEREAADAAAVDPNLAPLFLTAAAQEGDLALFDHYVAIYRQRRAAGAAPQETDRYLNAFPAFEAPQLLARVLDLLEHGVLPRESQSPLLTKMLARPAAQAAAWAYLKMHWATLRALSGLAAPKFVAAAGSLPNALRADVVAFFDKHLQGMAPLTYARALETLDQRTAFLARLRPALLGRFVPDDGRRTTDDRPRGTQMAHKEERR